MQELTPDKQTPEEAARVSASWGAALPQHIEKAQRERKGVISTPPIMTPEEREAAEASVEAVGMRDWNRDMVEHIERKKASQAAVEEAEAAAAAAWAADMAPEPTPAKRGRKAAAAPVPAPVEALAPAVAQGIAQEASLVRQVQGFANADQAALAHQLGAMSVFNFMARMGDVARTKWLAEIKERKGYRGLTTLNAKGEMVTLNTFEDLCAVMGISRAKADEDIRNLASFGEEFLEAAQNLGIGYRQLRQLRALPEAERSLEIDGGKLPLDDPEAVKDWVEDTLAKNAKLQAQLKEKDADLDAKDKVLATKNRALDAAQTKLAKMSTLDTEAHKALDTEKQSEALATVAEKAGLALEGMEQFFATLSAALELKDLTPHMREYLEGAARAVATSVADMCATRLDFDLDFQGMVYPDYMRSLSEQAASNAADNDN